MLIPGKRLTVFSIKNTDRKGTIWCRVGTAFVNKDESLNVFLDALPLDGKLHCRESTAERNPPPVPEEVPAELAAAAPRLAAAGGGL
ncbi:MAG TPA: hypothetical protein VIG99_10420 [Myxococcaceae bacterium]|jgi:hypothetical protein